mgnify:CR=1 FL=1
MQHRFISLIRPFFQSVLPEETACSKYFHKESSGTGAVTSTTCLETGCIKCICLACSDIPPSGLERFAPYFKSPFIGEPIFAS